MKFRNQNIHGEITISESGMIEGYVLNLDRNTAALAIDIFIDDTYLDTVLCNLKRQINLSGKPSRINTGFIYRVPKLMLKSAKTISIALTNTEKILVKTQIENLLTSKEKIVGVVHYDGGLTLSGWAINLKNPSKKLEVEFIEGEKIIGKVKAEEVYAHGSNYFDHGFSFTLPVMYLDGENHQITVRAETVELENSPIIISALPTLFSEWVETEKVIDTSKKSLIVKHLRDVERICQRGVHFSFYPFWKDSFCKVKVISNLYAKIKKSP